MCWGFTLPMRTKRRHQNYQRCIIAIAHRVRKESMHTIPMPRAEKIASLVLADVLELGLDVVRTRKSAQERAK